MSPTCDAAGHRLPAWHWQLTTSRGERFVFCDQLCLLGWLTNQRYREPGPALPRIVAFRRTRGRDPPGHVP